MKVKRIVADVAASDPGAASRFYRDILGLDILMDMGWIATYGSHQTMAVQVSFVTKGGRSAPVPDLSIEVDDLDTALARIRHAKIPIEYGPTREPWLWRRFYVRDPFGTLVNILTHDPSSDGLCEDLRPTCTHAIAHTRRRRTPVDGSANPRSLAPVHFVNSFPTTSCPAAQA